MDEPEDHKKRKLGDEGKVAAVDSYPEQSGKRQRTHALLGKEVAPSKVGNREVKLLGNYYRVRWAENKIFIHHMHYEPLEEGEATVSVWVKKQVLQANKAELGQYMFWGEHLFSMKDLSGQVFKASVRGIDYTLTLGERILIRDNAAAKERMQMFSNILKSVLARQKFIRIRDSIFDTHKARQIPGYQVEAIPGFSTNIDYFHGGMMLNVDVRWKYTQTKSIKDMFDRKDRNARLALVEGQHVLTMYADRRGDRRFYRVTTIDFDKTPRSTFPKRRRESGAHKYAELKEEEISFLDYYKQTHNITIRDADQPLLKVIEKRRNPTDGTQVEAIIYLIPELCVLAGLPEDMRNDGQLRRKTMEVTTQLPQQRIDEVSSLVGRLQPGHPVPDRRNPGQSMDPGSLLAAWGIQIDSKPLHVLGRGMESETLYLNGRTPKTIGTNGEWRDLFGAPPTQRGGRPAEGGPGLFVPVALNNWALVYLHNNDNAATAMVQAFHTVKKELRMEISDPVRAAVSRTNDLPLEMNKLYEASVRNGRPFDMMVAILPTANAEVYKGVKQIMTNHPVLTQAMKAGNLDGRNIESKCKGVLEQIVSKMGGTPWGVKIPFKTPTMIMGIDVSHSKTTAQGSVLALTATLNDYYSQYFSDVRVQGRNQEMASGIADSFNKALEAFMARNKVFPKRVIVYRDDPGGHGFLAALLESEVEMMQAVLKSRGIEASLAVIVVRKRGLTRLFSEDGRNPLPGTLVDTGLVSKDYNDFYLVAHSSRNGTVAPTQYQIVYRTESPRDEGLATRILQELSYKLCHLYYNFMGTIAEPAPLRYADRLAGFARQTMTRACPVATLADKLYYL